MCYSSVAGGHAGMVLAQASRVQTGCANEPAMFKGYPEMVRPAKENGVPFVGLVTNAQLLSEADVDVLIGHGPDGITLGSRGPGRRCAPASSPVSG